MTRSHRSPLLGVALALIASLACATVTRLTTGMSQDSTPTPSATAVLPGDSPSPDDQTPFQVEGGPTIGTPRETRIAIAEQQTRGLDELTTETYTETELQQVGETFTYTAQLDQDEPLFWGYTWCATTPEILQDNLEKMTIEAAVDGVSIPLDQFYAVQFQNSDGLYCQGFVTLAYNWPEGKTNLEFTITYTELVNDGLADYPAGAQMFVYEVTR